jgi:hypothetical protein
MMLRDGLAGDLKFVVTILYYIIRIGWVMMRQIYDTVLRRQAEIQ